MALTKFLDVSIVSGEVKVLTITSTPLITGTGFIKWRPITLSFLFTVPAIELIGRAEVLEAKIVSGGQTASNSLKMLIFKSRISGAHSITNWEFLASFMSVVGLMRARIAFFSSSVQVPFFINLSKLPEIVAMALTRNSSL